MLVAASHDVVFAAVHSAVLVVGGDDYGLAYHPIPPVLVKRDWSGNGAPARQL